MHGYELSIANTAREWDSGIKLLDYNRGGFRQKSRLSQGDLLFKQTGFSRVNAHGSLRISYPRGEKALEVLLYL